MGVFIGFSVYFPGPDKDTRKHEWAIRRASFSRAQPQKTRRDTSGRRVLKMLLPSRMLAVHRARNDPSAMRPDPLSLAAADQLGL
jgi:hypothetical protein